MCRTAKELRDYMAAQIAEIFGPDNMWFAGQALRHPPSPDEAFWHYHAHGGPEHFAEKWRACHQPAQS